MLAVKDDFLWVWIEYFVGQGVESYAGYHFGVFGALAAAGIVAYVIGQMRSGYDPEYVAQTERDAQEAEKHADVFVRMVAGIAVGLVSWLMIAAAFEMASMGDVGAWIAVVPSGAITVGVVWGLLELEKRKLLRERIVRVTSPVFYAIGFALITAIVFALLWAIMTRVFPELETMGRLGAAIVVALSAIVTALGYTVHSRQRRAAHGAK
jgi:hypothetical protein